MCNVVPQSIQYTVYKQVPCTFHTNKARCSNTSGSIPGITCRAWRVCKIPHRFLQQGNDFPLPAVQWLNCHGDIRELQTFSSRAKYNFCRRRSRNFCGPHHIWLPHYENALWDGDENRLFLTSNPRHNRVPLSFPIKEIHQAFRSVTPLWNVCGGGMCSQNCEKRELVTSCLSVCLSVCLPFRPSVCQPVCPSAWNNSAATRRIFVKFGKWVHLEIETRIFKFRLKLRRVTRTLHDDLCTFMTISRWTLIRMRNILDKICRQNQNKHFAFNNFFPKMVPFMR